MRQPSLSHVLPSAGEVIGDRYELRREVAGGGMGVVFEGVDLVTGRDVAVKVLRPEAIDVGDVAARFEREGKLAARMVHPNVVRMLDVGTTPGGIPYLVMELLVGRDLSKELKLQRRFSTGLACDIVGRACDGVAAIHAQGIVHRDLKPSNIFLAREGVVVTPKVLDFGVSKVMDTAGRDATMTHVAIGTPLYMSPEQVRSARRVDERTDVWAMGVILFQLLSGKTPFDGEGPTAIAAAIVADEPLELRALRPDIPEELAAVVRGALEKSPAKRTATVLALRNALAPFAARNDDSLSRQGPLAAEAKPDDPSGPSGTRVLHTPPSDASAPPLHVDSSAPRPSEVPDAPTALMPLRFDPAPGAQGGLLGAQPSPATPPPVAAPTAPSRRPIVLAALGGVGLGALVLVYAALVGGAPKLGSRSPDARPVPFQASAEADSAARPSPPEPSVPAPASAEPLPAAPSLAPAPAPSAPVRPPSSGPSEPAPAVTSKPQAAKKPPAAPKSCARKILVDGKLVCP